MYPYNLYNQQLQQQYGVNSAQIGAYNKQEIIKVNGEQGALAYQLMPNSSALLLDANNPIVWLVQSDGAGYRTATPYDIAPHKQQTQADYNNLESRIKRIEEVLNESNLASTQSSTKANKHNSVSEPA